MLGRPKYHSDFYQLLLDTVGESHVSIREIDRLTYARDSNFQSTIQVRAKHFPYPPDIIVWPKGPEEIGKIFKLARRYRVPIVPYGGGSGVCGGTLATKGGLILDMKRNSAVLEFNKREFWIAVETGMNGQHLEMLLNRKGYTLGHFPSSIYCSTVGGWLATRSAGQCSSRYGKIEDMVLAIEMVLPSGEIVRTPYVKNLEGEMDWTQLFVGTEGTLGVITKVWLKIHSLPETRLFRAFSFPGLKTGVEAMRAIMQANVEPAILRLYDEIDSLLFLAGVHKEKGSGALSRLEAKTRAGVEALLSPLKSWGMRRALSYPGLANRIGPLLQSEPLLILGVEGFDSLAKLTLERAVDCALDLGGQDLGPELGEHWLAHRYDVSYKASPLFFEGAFLDTMEVASTWDRLDALYEAVKSAIEPHALVMAHFSHAYREGGSIYFTFVAFRPTATESEALYERIWREGLSACQEVGGVISHHHGIGRLKVDFMDREWNEGIHFLRTFKNQWDGLGLMNPGKLIPDERDDEIEDL